MVNAEHYSHGEVSFAYYILRDLKKGIEKFLYCKVGSLYTK